VDACWLRPPAVVTSTTTTTTLRPAIHTHTPYRSRPPRRVLRTASCGRSLGAP
jgi:hypothetical protein